MATESGAFSTYNSVGNREDLRDAIYNIDPEETPLGGLLGSTSIKAVRHDWQTDSLATPAANAHIEGAAYSYAEVDPTVRVANYAQISRKTVKITKTQDMVSKAGRGKELRYQLTKKSVELRKDIEYDMVRDNASVAGSESAAREAASFPSFLTTNASRGTNGADGGWNSGTGIVDAATAGTQRSFTKALLDGTIELTFKSGGNPSVVMLSAYNKTVFSGFMTASGVAAFRYNYSKPDKRQGIILAAADTYVSDFGTFAIMPNRVMSIDTASSRNVLVIQPDMAERGVLRPFSQTTPAKTGDADNRVIDTEWTLIVKNEKAHGIVADVHGLTTTT